MRRILFASAAVLTLATAVPAQAAYDPFLGEVMLVAFTFCPNGWLPADGRLLPISQNTALFSLLGPNFGGDGISTFALPNFVGQAPNSNQANAIYCIAVEGIYPSRP